MLPSLVLITVLLFLFTASWHFSNVVIYPKTKTLEELREAEVEDEQFDPIEFASWPKEEIYIPSPYGYELFGLYSPIQDSKKTAVIVHGIGMNHYRSVRYASIFRERGFSVLMIDLRNHGLSGGSDTSYGFYEKYDLKAWIDWVFERCGADCIVGTHGESMGAATALQHAAIDPRLSFVVADCPYANAEDEFAYRLKVEYHLPKFPLLTVADLITKWRTGFAFGDAAPIKVIANVDVPVFFIHGEEDDYIPPEASIALYEAKQGKKKLYLVPGAGHAQAYPTNPEVYGQLVGEFLEEIACQSSSFDFVESNEDNWQDI